MRPLHHLSTPHLLAGCAGAILVLGGCTDARTSSVPGTVSKPWVRPELDARYSLGEKVTMTSRISAVQVLWMTFTSGDVGKYGATTGSLDYVGEPFSLGDLCFGPPVSQRRTAEAAYYDATTLKDFDALVQTKVKTERTGFTFLGLFGWGECAATIEGYGARIIKDPAAQESKKTGRTES